MPNLRQLFATAMLSALVAAALPVKAQDTGEDRRAIEACRAEAAARRVPVLRVGTPDVRRNHDDQVIGFNVPMVVDLDGRTQTVNCRYQSAGRRATLAIPSAPAVDRPPIVPSFGETERACRRDAERRGFRIERLVFQNDLRDRRGRITGRETALNLRRDGRNWRGICTFDFARGTSRFDAFRR